MNLIFKMTQIEKNLIRILILSCFFEHYLDLYFDKIMLLFTRYLKKLISSNHTREPKKRYGFEFGFETQNSYPKPNFF